MRNWRAANPTKYREYNRKYREENAERYKGLIRDWAKANPEKIKGYHLKATYGITLDEKNEMIAAQEGRCGICKSDNPGTPKGWQVDADHSVSPAKVRGILCKNCNTSLGNFNHSKETLLRAIKWLER